MANMSLSPSTGPHGELKDLLELLVSLGVVNNNKFFSIEFKNSLDSIGGYLEAAHFWGIGDNVDHLTLLVFSSDFEGVSAGIIKDQRKERWSLHFHDIGSHHGRHLILEHMFIVFLDISVDGELVEVHILALEINMSFEFSIQLIETSSRSGKSGAEHGSRWDVEHGLQVSIDDISVNFSVQKEVSFLVFDEFNKDLGLSLDGQLHVSEVGFHNKFLSSLVVNSNSHHWQAIKGHWAWHP